MSPRRRATVLRTVVVTAILISACAGPRRVTNAPEAATQFITAEQIRATGASTAWEALKFTVRTHQFRDNRGVPQRIVADRGQGSLVLREDPLIFLDGVRLVDLALLRAIPADNLFSIQVFTGPDATTYFGTSAVAGVILLETTLGGEEGDSVPPDTGTVPRP
jgi:outer membrane receptor protein involved in Fe transport